MKRTLAEDLADFANPAPKELDTDELDAAPRLIDPDEELFLGSPKKRPKHSKETRRLRAAVHLDSPTYRGQQISAAAAFQGASSDENSSGSLSQGSSENDQSAESNSDSESSDNHSDELENGAANNAEDMEAGFLDPEEDPSEDDNLSRKANGYSNAKKLKMNGHLHVEDMGSDDDEDASADSDSADQSESSISAEDSPSTGSDAEDTVHEGADDDDQVVERMRNKMAKDRERAQAVKNQHTIWERLLELRILLQKCLSLSYALPSPSASKPQKKDSCSDLCQYLTSLCREAADLQCSYCSQNSEIQQDCRESNLDPANLEMQWDSLTNFYENLAPFRDSSLDRWYRKTLMLSGSAALKSNLRVFNQNISTQVANTMKTSEKKILSAHLQASEAPRKLFSPPAENTDGHDMEAYDDSQFYQELLKEFLESKGASMQSTGITRQRKSRNNKDRKASKGRRIRYDVQEKLVNFMAAVRYEEPPMASQLFRNLFGQKV